MVPLYETLAHVQTKPGVSDAELDGVAAPVEALKQAVLVLCRNTEPGVRHGDGDIFRACLATYCRGSVIVALLYGVGDEIADDLINGLPVPFNHRQIVALLVSNRERQRQHRRGQRYPDRNQ